MTELMIGWTTAPDQPTAKNLADGLIQSRLAACVQVSGPMMSHYLWSGNPEISQEYHLCVKYLELNGNAIVEWLNDNHPYDIPEWVAVKVDFASSKYLMWAQSVAPENFN